MQKNNVVDMKSAMDPTPITDFKSLPAYRLSDWETILLMDADPNSTFHAFLSDESRKRIRANVLAYKQWRDRTGFVPPSN